MKKTQITLIPFDGFYESHAMSVIESTIEIEVEHHEEQGTPIDPNEAKIDFTAFARLIPNLYNNWLDKEHDIKLDSLTFESLESPRFYNYGTDKIYCAISRVDIWKLYRLFVEDEDEAQERINDRFKSRPGFTSFYSDFVKDWKTKPLSQWDHNELSILFPEPDYSYFYDDANCNGEISDCITYPENV